MSLIYSARMTDNKDFRTRYGHRAHLLDNSIAQYPHCIQYCMKQQYPCPYVKSLYTLDYMTQLLIIVLKSKKKKSATSQINESYCECSRYIESNHCVLDTPLTRGWEYIINYFFITAKLDISQLISLDICQISNGESLYVKGSLVLGSYSDLHPACR